MNDVAKLALAAIAAVLVGASSGSVAERCADDSALASVTAYCGFVAPEDMVSVDDKVLVISSMEPTDFLYGFDLESHIPRVGDAVEVAAAGYEFLGDMV